MHTFLSFPFLSFCLLSPKLVRLHNQYLSHQLVGLLSLCMTVINQLVGIEEKEEEEGQC